MPAQIYLTPIPKAAREYARRVGTIRKPQGKLKALQDNQHGRSGLPSRSSPLCLRPDQRRSRAILAFAFLGLFAGVALLPLPSGSPFLGVQTCAFKGVTGLPCALCGGSRATQAALRGDFARASYLNVGALPSIVLAGSVALLLGYEAIRGNAVINWRTFTKRLRPLLPLLLALFCFYWIVHLVDAVRGLKLELVDLRNPIARSICQRFSDARQ